MAAVEVHSITPDDLAVDWASLNDLSSDGENHG